jgi:hypothetical protein
MNYFPVKMKAACQIGGFFCSDYFSFFLRAEMYSLIRVKHQFYTVNYRKIS